MCCQTRPLKAVFVLSSISVVMCSFSCLFFAIYAPCAIATILYHVVIGLAHLRANTNKTQTESRPFDAFAYVDDVSKSIWRSAVRFNRVRLGDDGGSEEGGGLLSEMEPQEPRERLYPTASLTSIVLVSVLAMAWLTFLGLTITITVLIVFKSPHHRRVWLNGWLWVRLFVVLAEVVALVAIARICKRMRNSFFARAEGAATLGGEKAGV